MNIESPEPDGDQSATTVGIQSGQKVGNERYTLKRLIGRGGMGVVWLALDESLGEEVALKFLPPQIRFDPTALDDLRRETTRSRRLTHANIIRIHDLFESKGQDAFISMEYVNGQTLNALRLQQPGRIFSWEYLAHLIKQLCEALEYAHSENVVHRDLKPANLMIDTRGRLKLADFGIARVVTDSISRVSVRRETSGTLVYMSPQQLDGKPSNPTDDIYSLGATLYELLTSKPPFYTGEIAHQIRYITADALVDRLTSLGLSNEIPLAGEETIAACLAKNPTQRPQGAREVSARLGLVETRSGTSKSKNRPGTARAPSYGKSSANRLGVLKLASLAAITLVGATAWYYFQINQTSASRNIVKISTGPSRKEIISSPTVSAPSPGSNSGKIEVVITSSEPPKKPIDTNVPPKNPEQNNIPILVEVKTPQTATKPIRPLLDQPPVEQNKYPRSGETWTNGLGMVFVPVPGTLVLFSTLETRVQDFEAFAKEIQPLENKWKNPGYVQESTHPVVNVNWLEAKAFCDWLTARELKEGKLDGGQIYRLPDDLEWSKAVGLPAESGKTPKERSGRLKKIYPWGNVWPPPDGAGNFAGKEVEEHSSLGSSTIRNYRDRFVKTAPVRSFPANQFGIYDLAGNVWEWTQDWMDGLQQTRVLRGAAWETADQDQLLSSYRYDLGPLYRLPTVGFRCVLYPIRRPSSN